MTLSWAILEKGMYDHARASVEHEPFGQKAPVVARRRTTYPSSFISDGRMGLSWELRSADPSWVAMADGPACGFVGMDIRCCRS